MSLSIAELNALDPEAAAGRLRDCCGASAWVRWMVARRPFRSLEHLLTEAEAAWRALGDDEQAEAFAHHPGIGAGETRVPVSHVASGWSAGEQRSAQAANEGVRAALVEANAAYERRFGRIYIVCATGLRAEDILRDVERRLGNDADTERRVAAAEQAKITMLRLRKLIGEDR